MISLILCCFLQMYAKSISADTIINQLPTASSQKIEKFADLLAKDPKIFSEVTKKALAHTVVNPLLQDNILESSLMKKKICLQSSDVTGIELLKRWQNESGISVICSLPTTEIIPFFSAQNISCGEVLLMILYG